MIQHNIHVGTYKYTANNHNNNIVRFNINNNASKIIRRQVQKLHKTRTRALTYYET